MTVRPASKAGIPHDPVSPGWYHEDPQKLGEELDEYMARVPATIDGSPLPVPGARIIIAPHAGYEHSGPCAAWAYSCLDVSKAKRVFVLGPSHTYYLGDCAASGYSAYATPFGNLAVDRATVDKIRADSGMGEIPERYERKEHSLEMHMPYLYKVCERAFASPADFPKIVPLLIGSHGFEGEQQVGRLLAPYLADPANAFIVSSDFCHWGHHAFSYTPYSPDLTMEKLTWLSPSSRAPDGAPIHESIKMLDEAAMDAVKSGSHAAFFENLKLTENTVCGRHPIGVAMAAMEVHARQLGAAEGPRFSIVKYDRSNLVTRANGHSVSYVSAYAVL